MTTKETHDVVIYSATRARSSAVGNPSWFLDTNRGRYRTRTDALIGYSIDNMRYCPWRTPSRQHVIGNPSEPRVTLVTTARGTVYDVTDHNGETVTR